MQDSVSNAETKSNADRSSKNRLLVNSGSQNNDSLMRRLSANLQLSSKSDAQTGRSDIKLQDSLTPLPFRRCDDILEIRSIRPETKAVNSQNQQNSIVTINVSGSRFQTYLSTLEFYPHTLLGDKNKRQRFWNSTTEEYFFDRNRSCFEAILYYYQSNGRLRRPEFVALDTFLEEITFFQLGSDATDQVKKTENVTEVESHPMPHKLWRRYIWFYLEFPQHSWLARLISIFSLFFTILSCVSLAIESLPQYTNQADNICKAQANLSMNVTYVPRCAALFQSPFFIIQSVCVAFFTAEFTARLISTPSYRRFLFTFSNWIDLGAIIPYYVFLGIQLTQYDIALNASAVTGLRLLRVLRFSRIFKIYMVFRRLKSLRVLSATIRESLLDFAVMICIITLLAFLFGAGVYFAEQDRNPDTFDSIPVAIYWGIITITGVGYGDMYPITTIGRVITCFCAMFGTATMGMLASVLVDRYQRVYNRKMYVTEPELPAIDIDHDDDETKQASTSSKSLTKNFSQTFSHALSSLQLSRKHDNHPVPHVNNAQPYQLQFQVSIKDLDHHKQRADQLLTLMKAKLTEAVSTTNVDIDLKLVDNNNQELWAISSGPDSSLNTISNITISVEMHGDDDNTSQAELF